MSKSRKRTASFITEDSDEESPTTKHRRLDNCGGQGNGNGHSRVSSKGKSSKSTKCYNKHKFVRPSRSGRSESSSSSDHDVPEARNNVILGNELVPAECNQEDTTSKLMVSDHQEMREEGILSPSQEPSYGDLPIQLLTVEVQTEDTTTNSALHEDSHSQATIANTSADNGICQLTSVDLEVPGMVTEMLELPTEDVPIQLVTEDALAALDSGLQGDISQTSTINLEVNEVLSEGWELSDVPIELATVEVVTDEDPLSQTDMGQRTTIYPEVAALPSEELQWSEDNMSIQPVTVEVLTEDTPGGFRSDGVNPFIVQDNEEFTISVIAIEENDAHNSPDETHRSMLVSTSTCSTPTQNNSVATCPEYLEQRDRTSRERRRISRRSERNLRRRRQRRRNRRPSLLERDTDNEDDEVETSRASRTRFSELENYNLRTEGASEILDVDQVQEPQEQQIDEENNEENEVRNILSAILELAAENGIPLQEFFEVEVVDEVEDSNGLTEEELDTLQKRKFGEQDSNLGTSYQCSICLTNFEHGDTMRTLSPCGHEFHLTCIDEWLKFNATCPLCRTSITPK